MRNVAFELCTHCHYVKFLSSLNCVSFIRSHCLFTFDFDRITNCNCGARVRSLHLNVIVRFFVALEWQLSIEYIVVVSHFIWLQVTKWNT